MLGFRFIHEASDDTVWDPPQPLPSLDSTYKSFHLTQKMMKENRFCHRPPPKYAFLACRLWGVAGNFLGNSRHRRNSENLVEVNPFENDTILQLIFASSSLYLEEKA